MQAATTAETRIAVLAASGIVIHLLLRWRGSTAADLPLWIVLATGGVYLVIGLTRRLASGEYGSDLVAGVSIATAALLGQHLVGSIVVLMLAGGAALEQMASSRATSVLDALARRMPLEAHRKRDGSIEDIGLAAIAVGDTLVLYPHEICPVDGMVVEGHGVMDESYLTGEPYMLSKTPGSQVLSGAVNGETALTIQASRLSVDSRYARIMEVLEASAGRRPRLRRIADRLGAWYTPLSLAIAGVAWAVSGDSLRFLAVLVVATPCPLLIAVPVAVVGSIALAARRGIVVRNPVALEVAGQCQTMLLDKTGTLTYGRPTLSEIVAAEGVDQNETLRLAASLERYSRHPLANPVVAAARKAGLTLSTAEHMSERPGEGLDGVVDGRRLRITGRQHLDGASVPPAAAGLECAVVVDGRYQALFRFHDEPRPDSEGFIGHLGHRHSIQRVILLSGDREAEVQYLARAVGVRDVRAGQSPEQKLAIVEQETARALTLFVGDGINDAPALNAATVGIAFGANDVTAAAAGAIILEASLAKVDEFLHIGARMRRIALQSAVGGIAASLVGMGFAALGWLPPLAGAVVQELIDLAAVLNAVRAALPFHPMTDFIMTNGE